ncbi:uncharacterized protein LOC142140704 isoform X2 [Mixophyes fleayi]|uniref:uncharacterized protein LOC142140704 isoform X2 n=1 Tax=Mixophyes fleayi TaxID=3061075 RepID=UPI003F4DFF7A
MSSTREKGPMTETILNLTLEIIYLLTGEDYIVVKKLRDHDTEKCVADKTYGPRTPIMDPPPRSLIHDQKILEVTHRIIKLLTAEVPIRCQDVTVYFSMEEWEYVEGHKDLYQDVMTDDSPVNLGGPDTVTPEASAEIGSDSELRSLCCQEPDQETSAPDSCTVLCSPDCIEEETRIITQDCQAEPGDGIIRCKEEAVPAEIRTDDDLEPSERCETPLYSPHCIEEENRIITQDYQAETGDGVCHQQNKEEAVPAEISSGDCSSRDPPERCETPVYSPHCIEEENRIITQDSQAEPEAMNCHPPCKEEAVPAEISSGECSSRNPPGRCETPVYSPDCIEEEIRIITQDYQAEPGDEIFHPQCKEEAVPAEISSGGCSSRNPPERCETPVYSPDCIEEENRIITQDYQAEPGNGIFRCKEEAVPAEISSGGDTGTEPDAADYRGPQEFPCIGPLVSSHYPDKMHQCLACQRYFPNRSALVIHQKTHSTINLFSCSICGVCFDSKLLFTAHQQFHMEEKSFDCSQCGKSFNRKSRLLSHKRTHTGEKPFSCPECGRCFAERSALVTHKRIHSGEKPFNCKECGKRFVQGSSLMKHQRIHTGERPFVCFQCGRCFSDSSNLFRHQRIHSREKSFMS